MPFIKWDESYSVGIAELDDQHKKILDLINKLHETMTRQHSRQEIKSTITDLKDYAQSHFSTEEKFFEKIKYPHRKEHHKLHDKFIEHVMDLDLREEDQGISPMDILTFLKDWLKDHVLTEDQKYKNYLNRKPKI